MKKLLYQFDTDEHPSVFDSVVCHDGGADHVIGYGGVHPHNVGAMVDGTIFTRAPKDKKNTAIFIGGSNMAEGEALFKAVKKKFFSNFRVSVMLDSNGSNTTAAACVAWLAHKGSLKGKKVVILGGTGPVGTRAAVMLASEGATVTLVSRKLATAEDAAKFPSSTSTSASPKRLTMTRAAAPSKVRTLSSPPVRAASSCWKSATGRTTSRSS
jgi:D-arabinose 1-dehydrogenase-like Zn-dependent alcohol dehydrogenase